MELLELEDPAVVAALYDPTRYRIFRLLGEPRSVSELAAELDVPADRLYYHVKRLSDCGLVRQVDARASGRHTERIYGRAAKRIRFSGELQLDGEGPLGAIAAGLAEGLREAEDALLSYHEARLTEERASELERRLRDLLAEYADDTGGERRFGILGVLTPLAQGAA